jgi:hypothetical protein
MMELNEEQKLALRQAARERKRTQRERDKRKRIRTIEAQQAASERVERRRRNLHFYAEVSPGRNAKTLADELQSHREWLRALGEGDVRENETLRDIARRTYNAWLNAACRSYGPPFYVPAFNRTRQEFDDDFGYEIGDVSFEESWTPPKDCTGDEPIDITTLPKLPKVFQPHKTKAEKPKPEPKPLPPPPTPVVPPQPNVVNFSWVPPHAYRFLNGNGSA